MKYWTNLKAKLKVKLRAWLEIDTLTREVTKQRQLTQDLVSIGVDVHFKSPHMILIYSRLNGGQIREIPVKFDTMQELLELVRELKARYNTSKIEIDAPEGAKYLFRDLL